jgi:hypothetical protein
MATATDIQESAQALFCALGNKHGVSNIDKTFNKETYPSYFDFKSFWNNKYKTVTIEKAFETHVKSGKATLKEVEDLLYGVGKKGKKANEWYHSSLQIAKQLIKEIDTISTKFNYVKSGNWSDVFWAHGDKDVMANFIKLFTKANNFQKELYKHDNKIEKPFSDINKWSTADIYFASGKAKDEIEKLVKEEHIDYTKLNSFVGGLISEGILLPLSLKKQPNEVTIKKVNFDRPMEKKQIAKLEYGGINSWRTFNDKKDNINDYARTLIMYMAKDKSVFCQLRHDPSNEGYKGVVQLKVSTAFEGSLSAGLIRDILNIVEPSFGTKWYTIYSNANELFKEKKKYLDRELKDRDRAKYDEKREIISAYVTNVVNPPLIDWLNKDSKKANLFVRALYTYATARSDNSSKYVIAK